MSARYERIYLIGLPGSGKSTLAKGLAQKLGWDFLDTDLMIEHEEALSVSALFRQKGEPVFRTREAQVLRECASRLKVVVATGGGAAAHPGNLELMLGTGLTLWLNPETAEIAWRLGADTVQRPLFQGLDVSEIPVKLSQLLEERRFFYQKAHLVLNGTPSVEDVYLSVYQLVT